jgi:NAD-dependent DNA ligase
MSETINGTKLAEIAMMVLRKRLIDEPEMPDEEYDALVVRLSNLRRIRR